MALPTNTSPLLRPLSLVFSGALLLLPIALYMSGRGAAHPRSLIIEAFFWLSLSVLFLGARTFSTSIAAFFAVRWLSESWATFARPYRTIFFGLLCLFALAATVFELTLGVKVTHWIAAPRS